MTPNHSHPVLLVPVRIETRFKDAHLWIRFYPDQFSIDTHDTELTRDEINAGIRYRNAFDEGDNVAKRDAWRQIASSLGIPRAAYVSRTMLRDRDLSPVEKQKNWRVPPRLRGLPDHFEVFAYRDDELIHHIRAIPPGGRISDDLSIMAAPEALQQGMFDANSQWVVDFAAAEAAGMAVKIELSETDLQHGFSRLIAVGLRQGSSEDGKALLEELLDAHRFTDGIGFVPCGTPTNNTPEAKSGYGKPDGYEERSFETEVQGCPLWHLPTYVDGHRTKYPTNAQNWGSALGLGGKSETLRYVESAGDFTDSYAMHLQDVLSPVLIRYMFDEMLPGVLGTNDAGRVAGDFARYVRARGPLPAIRIGNQPYGVLPVSAIRRKSDERPFGWEPSMFDIASLGGSADIADKLQLVSARMFERWLKWANNKTLVPRVTRDGDPEEELLQILSMQPTSVSYQARPFIGEDFITWLLIASQGRLYPAAVSADGKLESGDVSAVSILMDWYRQWKTKQGDAANILHYFGGTSSADDDYSERPLFRLSGWRDGATDPIGATVGATPDDKPERYLPALVEEVWSAGPEATSQTLLFDMIRRAQKLDSRTNTHLRTLLGSPIDDLDTGNALDFFNTATTPQQIVERIQDDPDFGRGPPRAYGVRLSLAKRILEARDRLPGSKFHTLEQIDAIRGVGDDTWHDILYSFPEIPPLSDLRARYRPDFDSLFRQTLDLVTHRLDAWLTAAVYRRLRAMRVRAPEGIHFGAYCWVEDLVPTPTLTAHRSLDFFNRARRPESIVDRVWGYRDDLSGGKSQLDLLQKLAKQIVAHRETLPDKKIRSEAQLKSIKEQFRVEWMELIESFDRLSEGYVHAPSAGHAATAAVLHNAFLTHKNHTASGQSGYSCCVNLHSDRVRRGLRIVEGIRQGQSLGALLGFQYERWLPDHLRRYIDDFRRAFPTVSGRGGVEAPIAVETVSARNVVDGAALARRWRQLCDGHTGAAGTRPNVNALFSDEDPVAPAHDAEVASQLDGMLDALDAVADLLLAEAVYQSVRGNYERGGAALEAASGNAPPPEIRSMETPISGTNLGHRLCMLFPEHAATTVTVPPLGPRSLAEPRVATWFAELLGPLSEIGCTAHWDSLGALNHADVATLVAQLGLPEGTVHRLVDERIANGPFGSISGVLKRVPSLSEADVAGLTQLVTEESLALSLAELGAADSAKGIDFADLLYLAASSPAGAQTELEQRIAVFVREYRGLSEDVRVVVHASELASFPRSLKDAIHLAQQALHTLGGRSFCGPDALCAPIHAGEAAFAESDVDELAQRVSAALAAANGVLAQISVAVAEDGGNRDSVVSGLFDASRFGIASGIPGANPEVGLESLRSDTVAEFAQRVACCEQLKTQAQSTLAEAASHKEVAPKVLDLYVEAMRALFGAGFIVLPTFTIHEAGGFAEALDDQSVLADLGEERVRLWLQQVAQVHSSLQQLDDLLMLAEVWQQACTAGGVPACSLKVAQLPYRPNVKWLALSDDERGGAPEPEENIRGTLSVVAALAGTPAPASGAPPRYAGVIFEHWDELLPHRTVNTSVSIHYNAPNTQAPQCLLLAVPPQDPASETTKWSTEELAQIVNDSFDLAKVRTVDLDALRQLDDDIDDRPDVGGMLPSILLPTNPDNPGWAREETLDLFNTWLWSTLRRQALPYFETFSQVGFPGFNQLKAYQDPDPLVATPEGVEFTFYGDQTSSGPASIPDFDVKIRGPNLSVAGSYTAPGFKPFPGLVCQTGAMVIELPAPASLIGIICGFFDVATEAAVGQAFENAVTALDENGDPVPLELQQIPSDAPREHSRRFWYLFESNSSYPPSLNPSVWHLSPPDASEDPEEAGDFTAYFAEFHVYDQNRRHGRKIKTVVLDQSTCLMRVEVYEYPKVEE